MNAGLKATGRPRQGIPLLPQLVALALAAGLLLEFARYLVQDKVLPRLLVIGPGARQHATWYEPHRAWVLEHRMLVIASALLATLSFLALYRWWLLQPADQSP